ncbi:MAG: hypothetical protein HAW59_05960, partial [Betaproteobacteria bacterium]|nr:hypothetical protein [Betaproteobacteria bacterium]
LFLTAASLSAAFYAPGAFAESTLAEKCREGTEPPRRIFRKVKGDKIKGSWRSPYQGKSMFTTADFRLGNEYLQALQIGLSRFIAIPGHEQPIYDEGVKRIWLHTGGRWLQTSGSRRDWDYYAPFYAINGQRRNLQAGDVISVLYTSHDKMNGYEPGREVARFRIYYKNDNKRAPLVIANGEKTAEVGCEVSGKSFFLRDDFTPTKKFEEAGTSFARLR